MQTGYEQASGCGQHKAGETLKLQEHSFGAGWSVLM